MKKSFIEPKMSLRRFLESNVFLASDNFGYAPDDWLTSDEFLEGIN